MRRQASRGAPLRSSSPSLHARLPPVIDQRQFVRMETHKYTGWYGPSVVQRLRLRGLEAGPWIQTMHY